ncbi:MAG: helix-turn-helix domain-containing protein [Pseudolabrys sp.]
MSTLDIAEVARLSGVPASTLRFYEERRLIKSVGRHGLRRLFERSVLQQLSLIALARAGGFALDDIASMFTPDGRPKIDRKQMLKKADELDAAIRHLKAMQNGLRHVAACPAPNHLDCPQFRRMLRLAGAGRLAPAAATAASRVKKKKSARR